MARIATEGIPYHITQRGNARQKVFFEDRDYLLYLDLLHRSCQQANLQVSAYCLMPNHIHLIAVPARPTSMSHAMTRTNADFARHHNLQQRTCGHVWQARYFSTPLDHQHLWQATAYVERNPVRARLAKYAEDFPWSSTRSKRDNHDQRGFLHLAAWRANYDWPRWQQVLETSVDEEAFGLRLQEASRRGRPLVSPEFIEDREKKCGRRLRPLPMGRPPELDRKQNSQMDFEFGV